MPTLSLDSANPAVGAMRPPRQKRSRATLEKMLDTAEAMLRERAGADFTMEDISRSGRVSVGSIYCRFAGKDAMIRAVQQRMLPQLEARQAAAIDHAREARWVPELVARLVDALAEPLREFAPILRPLRLRAVHDPLIAAAGRRSHEALADAFVTAILGRREWITHEDPGEAAETLFRIADAAIARFLGFGAADAGGENDEAWKCLKRDLAMMGTGFLMYRPDCARCWVAGAGEAAAPRPEPLALRG
jgi:AcrR family transcriptional regulator